MSEGVKKPSAPPPIKDKSLLAGDGLTDPQRRRLWLEKQSPEFQRHTRTLAERYDLILKAQQRGLLGWEQDPLHYRAHPHYCKCEGGTVEAHNERFNSILESVDDGR